MSAVGGPSGPRVPRPEEAAWNGSIAHVRPFIGRARLEKRTALGKKDRSAARLHSSTTFSGTFLVGFFPG